MKKMGKKRIAMIGHKRIPSREGGVEIVVEELATRLVAQGNIVTVYNRNGHHVSGKEFDGERLKNYKGVILKYVPTIDHAGLAAVSSSIIATICAAFGKYDIVHFHAEGPSFMCWLPKIMGKKIIVTIHGLDHEREKWGKFAKKYIMMGEHSAVKYADDIIVLSCGVQKYFERVYNRDTVFIPNGVERPSISEINQINIKWGLEKDSYILYLGRIVPEKGLKNLIIAFKNIKTEKKLVIAGGASGTENYVRELMNLAKDDNRIIFTGFVQGQILKELYSNCYIYTLPSKLEGMPLSLLEAMSYGNCCLVSSIKECTEVVEDKAVIFENDNMNDLRVKLQELCDDIGMVNTYRKQSRDFICSKYNWNDVVEQTLKLYQD